MWRKQQVHPLWPAKWWKSIQYYFWVMKRLEDLNIEMASSTSVLTVYGTVNWDGEPQDVFCHTTYKGTFSSKRHVQLAINRHDKN